MTKHISTQSPVFNHPISFHIFNHNSTSVKASVLGLSIARALYTSAIELVVVTDLPSTDPLTYLENVKLVTLQEDGVKAVEITLMTQVAFEAWSQIVPDAKDIQPVVSSTSPHIPGCQIYTRESETTCVFYYVAPAHVSLTEFVVDFFLCGASLIES